MQANTAPRIFFVQHGNQRGIVANKRRIKHNSAAKVCNYRYSFLRLIRHQRICDLNVPVDNAPLVQLLDTQAYISNYLAGFHLTDWELSIVFQVV